MLTLENKSQLEALRTGNVKESSDFWNTRLLRLSIKGMTARNSKWREMSVHLQMQTAARSSMA